MSYNIDKIKPYTSVKGVFFFDTNIWINIVSPGFNEDVFFDKYISFFEKVIDSEFAKIAVSPLLFSEIINLYLRRVAMPMYCEVNKKDIEPKDYKKLYRPTDDFKEQYSLICDEINQRKESFLFVNDIESDFKEVSSFPKLDYNDFSFFKICLEQDYVLVTHDYDFLIENLKVHTLNSRLYDDAFMKNLQMKKVE